MFIRNSRVNYLDLENKGGSTELHQFPRINYLTFLFFSFIFQVVCFIPKVQDEMYAALKKLMLIKCPMINQLITAQRILTKPDKYASFATKIVVQMASKLGAKPWAVKIPPKEVMVAGFDTYHKKDGDRQGRSFGAFACSLDPFFGRYIFKNFFR